MRKSLSNLLLFAIVFIISGCSKESNQMLLNLSDDYYLYDSESNTWFDVDSDGSIYYISPKPTGEIETYLYGNEEVEIEKTIDTLYKVDTLGNQTEVFASEDSINIGTEFIIKDNVVYYTDETTDISTNKAATKLRSINILTNESKEIGYLGEFESIKKMELIGDKVYYLGIQKGYKEEYAKSTAEIPYSYQGELIGWIDLATGIGKTLEITNPVAFARTTKDNLMIYAHDDKGYYFIEYDIPNKTFANNSIYHNLGRIYEFEIYNSNNDFIYNSTYYNECLSASSVEEDVGIIEIMPNVSLGYENAIETVGGYAYVYNVLIHKIERIKIDSYVNSNTTINLIQSQFIEEAPFGCGYKISRNELEEENFALKILSQDKDYDICLLSSRQDISQRIQSYGTFYPLNEVEGVQEYLEACFPNLKEAATTENGDIWMIPIALNVPLIFYNTDACSEAGVDPSAVKDLDTFMLMLDDLNGKDKKNLYNASGYVLTEHLMQQYLRENHSFQTDYFKELASMLKEQVNYRLNQEHWFSNGEVSQSFVLGKITNQLFTDSIHYTSQSLIGNRNPMIEARSFPHITENRSNIATCVFLAVNPESKNLKATLRYITALCDYLLNNNQSMVLQDRSLYPETSVYDDIYEIYQNGSVYFQLPSDILMEDYHDYLENKIDIDTLVSEAERKLGIYKNE